MRGAIRSFAIICAVIAPRLAHADDAHVKPALALLAQQCKAIAKDDMDALRATLTTDARVKLDRSEPSAVADLDWGFPAPEKCAVGKTQVGWSGTWGWVAAELRITTRMYAEPAGAGDPHPKPETAVFHWLAVIVPDGDGVKTRALYVARTVADKDLIERDPEEPAASPGPLSTLAATPTAIAAQLAADPAVTIFGTTDGEGALGNAAAKKLVSGWKTLQLAVIGKPEETVGGDLGFAFVPLQMRLKGKKSPYEVHALVVARKRASTWEVIALDYGALGY